MSLREHRRSSRTSCRNSRISGAPGQSLERYMERFRHSHYIFFVEVNIEILTDWTKEVFLPQAKVGSHALFDMWGGWKKPLTGEHVTEKELQIHYIPGMQHLLWHFYNTS